MLDQARIDAIHQKRMDALAAKHLHEFRLSSFNRRNLWVDLLAIGVPVLFLTVRYLMKGTPAASIVETISEVLAAILLLLAIAKMVFGWQSLAEKHSKLIGENISLASQAEQLLNNADTATPDGAQWFLMLADNLEKADREALGVVEDEDRKRAYREALKEYSPGSTQVCPECKASPWHYKPGSCQLCGNTPEAEQSKIEYKGDIL